MSVSPACSSICIHIITAHTSKQTNHNSQALNVRTTWPHPFRVSGIQVTAGSNFTHNIRVYRDAQHTLVTYGIYRWVSLAAHLRSATGGCTYAMELPNTLLHHVSNK